MWTNLSLGDEAVLTGVTERQLWLGIHNLRAMWVHIAGSHRRWATICLYPWGTGWHYWWVLMAEVTGWKIKGELMCLTQNRHGYVPACRKMGGTRARLLINADRSCDNIMVMCVLVCNRGSPPFLRLTRLTTVTNPRASTSHTAKNCDPAHICV